MCVTNSMESMNELTKRVITLNTNLGRRTPLPRPMEEGSEESVSIRMVEERDLVKKSG